MGTYLFLINGINPLFPNSSGYTGQNILMNSAFYVRISINEARSDLTLFFANEVINFTFFYYKSHAYCVNITYLICKL
jgi:hypothetical protein